MAGDFTGHSVRYGAREPWLAPWPRALVYLVWRAVFASARPAMFIGLLAGALWLTYDAVTDSRGESAPPDVAREGVFGAGIGDGAVLIPASARPLEFWETAIAQALEPGASRPPDLALAASLARALPDLKGRENLAFHVLAETRSAAHVNAELRARPAWERARRLDAALAARLAEGAHLDPPELVFARTALVQRLERAKTLFGPALEAAETWFLAPRGAALHLPAFPGWRGVDAVTLYGDARDLASHGCALAASMGRRPAGCAGVPSGLADPVLNGLLLQAVAAEGEAAPGWRLTAAAYASGHLDPDLARHLALGPDPVLGREALLASLTPLLVEADAVWAAPWRYQDAAQAAAREVIRAARLPSGEAHAIARALNQVRRTDGAAAALRTARWLAAPGDAARLARFARERAGRMLAFDALAGPDILQESAAPDRRPPRAPHP
ncbi:MAG: hypothetical protein JJU18_07225, partial [Oceanicaulis sp.]|nr:hypothetical protein [Oceanicaulis sp.]